MVQLISLESMKVQFLGQNGNENLYVSTNNMKKYFKEWWTAYAVGIFSGLITSIELDYWWVYILIFSFLIFEIDQYFIKGKMKK